MGLTSKAKKFKVLGVESTSTSYIFLNVWLCIFFGEFSLTTCSSHVSNVRDNRLYCVRTVQSVPYMYIMWRVGWYTSRK
jgi:hypothetical protein